MKKGFVIGFVASLLLIGIAVALFFFFSNSSNSNGAYALYFSDANRTALKAEWRDIESESEEELLNRAIEALLLGPQPSSDCVSVIPLGTQLKSASIDRNLVSLDFSSDLLEISDYVDKLLARYSIVKTVCDLSDTFSYVRLTVDGEPICDNYGNEIGLMSADDTLFDAVSTEQKNTKVILYFADETGENLVAEEREITVSEAETLPMSVLNELISGPKMEANVATVPLETKVYSVEVKNGTCYANFSPELVQKHSGGSTAEILTVYSIVNTLTALEGIEKVQFLIDGKIKDVFGNLIFSDPFVSNIR